jgi:hypothetical protein
MVMRFSGLGCLVPVLVLATLVAGIYLAGALAPEGFPGPTAGLIIAAVVLAGAPLQILLGGALNRRRRADGGADWVNAHTYMGVPVQRAGGVHVAFALLILAIVVGAQAGPWVGVAAFVGILVLAAVVVGQVRARSRRRGVAGRREWAEGRGWRYDDIATGELTAGWSPRLREQVKGLAVFGVVRGELDGVPFTAFDTEERDADHGVRHVTRSVVHLPVALPGAWLSVWDTAVARRFRITAPEEVPGRVVTIESHDPAFAEALSTHEVRLASVRYGVHNWAIDGRDLIWSRRVEAPPAGEELLDGVGRLVALARLFPSEVFRRFDRAPAAQPPV